MILPVAVDNAGREGCTPELLISRDGSAAVRKISSCVITIIPAIADAASAYLNKGFRLQNKISISSGELHNVASQIRRVAKQVYDAEMAALEIAMMRKY